MFETVTLLIVTKSNRYLTLIILWLNHWNVTDLYTKDNDIPKNN